MPVPSHRSPTNRPAGGLIPGLYARWRPHEGAWVKEIAMKLIRRLLAVALAAYILHAAYVQGVQHAVATAQVWAEGGVYLVDVDGQVHAYE